MYQIVRMYQKDTSRERYQRVIKSGLSLEEAQAWCRDPETSSSTCTEQAGCDRTAQRGPWFDGYEEL